MNQLRKMNASIFPVRYHDKFYTDVPSGNPDFNQIGEVVVNRRRCVFLINASRADSSSARFWITCLTKELLRSLVFTYVCLRDLLMLCMMSANRARFEFDGDPVTVVLSALVSIR